jgi:hypothetical protein
MTFIGKHLPELVPFMEDTYSPQAVNQARNSFKKEVRKASATFFYGAMCGFFTTDELDDLLFEASEVARFLLEVEGTTLDIDEEIDIEDRITQVMRSVGEAAKTILKSRAEEGESYDQTLVVLQPKKLLSVNNSAVDLPPGNEKTREDNIPVDFDPMDTRFQGTKSTTENLSLVNKKSALEGSISMGSVSEEVPVTRNQKRLQIPQSEREEPASGKMREHNGTNY